MLVEQMPKDATTFVRPAATHEGITNIVERDEATAKGGLEGNLYNLGGRNGTDINECASDRRDSEILILLNIARIERQSMDDKARLGRAPASRRNEFERGTLQPVELPQHRGRSMRHARRFAQPKRGSGEALPPDLLCVGRAPKLEHRRSNATPMSVGDESLDSAARQAGRDRLLYRDYTVVSRRYL
jgi:hypothetical protein